MKIKNLVVSAATATILLGGNAMAYEPTKPSNDATFSTGVAHITKEWDKTFKQDASVAHEKVLFKNRYGITLVGDLYTPKNLKDKAAAIVLSGPFGAVKEQSSGLYAQELAKRGFITLAFDPSYTGESGGMPRNLASPEINTEDFSAAIDYVGNLANVDLNKLGILGICGFGGFALNAAISDTRVKAVAVSTMYDMTRVAANGYEINMKPGADGVYIHTKGNDANARYEMKKSLNEQRWVDAKNVANGGLPAKVAQENHLTPQDKITEQTPLFVKQYSDYYKTTRGYHPRSINSNSGWNMTNFIAFINQPILQRASEMRAATLIVHGEKAHSRYFAEEAFKALGNTNKELVIVPDASHVDLYDNENNKIPFDKIEKFFKANLK